MQRCRPRVSLFGCTVVNGVNVVTVDSLQGYVVKRLIDTLALTMPMQERKRVGFQMRTIIHDQSYFSDFLSFSFI